jgi:hypothetical protein
MIEDLAKSYVKQEECLILVAITMKGQIFLRYSADMKMISITKPQQRLPGNVTLMECEL